VSAEETRPVLAACEWTFGSRPLGSIVASLAANGYDGIVIAGEPDRQDVGELGALLDTAGLSVVGATTDTTGRPERDLAHPDRMRRSEALDYYQRCVDLLARLGARVFGIVPSEEGRLTPIAGYAREWELAVAGARELALYAGERGVRIAIEPLNRYEAFLVNRVEQACAFVDEIGVDGVGVVADLFHMNIEEIDSFAALDRAGDRMLELHLADSNREGLGSGHLPGRELLERARALGFAGTFAVECLAPPRHPGSATDATEAARTDRFLAQCAAVVAEVFPAPPGG
jgi:sugar phosphate isomerase/epimerase